MIIEIDTRNKKDKFVTDYFDKNNIKWIRNKLYSGDVKILNDTKVIIDLKANLEEVVHNLCNTLEHNRVVREIERAREIGCKEFIFLIKDDKIKNIEDIKKWSSNKTKVKGETLYKIMNTFKEHHNCRFIIVPKRKIGEIIINLLNKQFYDII